MPSQSTQPRRPLASRHGARPLLRLVNSEELFAGLKALSGSQDAGSDGNGIIASRLVNGVEYAHASAIDERKLRSAWRRRQGGGATPLVAIASDPEVPELVRLLGPEKDGPLRRVRADSFLALVQRTQSLNKLQAIRLVAEEVERLDTEGVAGLKVRGLGTQHLYEHRLPKLTDQWTELTVLAEGVSHAGWRELLSDFGYSIEALPRQGHLAKIDGRPVAVIHPRSSAFQFARLDEEGRLPEGALIADCQAHGAPYGLLVAGSRMRLLSAASEDAGATTRYLELDALALEPSMAPLLALISPSYLADGGLAKLLADARDYGQELRIRLDLVLRQQVLPRLGRELGRWAVADGQDLGDDAVRADLEAAALTFVFRALFLLYAESAGHLPMTNQTYRAKSLTGIARRAAEELDHADPLATALWEDIASLVRRMRTGQTAWDLPAYNGDLFAADGIAGAATLERAAIPDASLAPALVALARDPENTTDVGVDFSGLEVGHLGYVYEGLLSLRLSLADHDYIYDERRDRYVRPDDDEQAQIGSGELLWLTNEGGRKSGGVYYTRTELVRHLVRGAVGPAFDRHLADVRDLAGRDPATAAEKLFDFFVLDPACGSAHFLVEVVDELADKIAKLLGEISLPAVGDLLEALRSGAGAFGAGIEDTALLKRLVLKRCVYGVDLSPMGAEIAKLSLWLSTFVPGLSLAYLDHNIQCGNSLIGVARSDAVIRAEVRGTTDMFGDSIAAAVADAAKIAARLRTIDDVKPEDFKTSRRTNDDLRKQIKGARGVFDLWTAEPLGLTGARDEASLRGDEVMAGRSTPLLESAHQLSEQEHFLHWPLAFPEVFAREQPGFDAVVGNPPWEEVTVEELAFYARYRPGLRALPQIEREREIVVLTVERPELIERLHAERGRAIELRRYFAAEYEGASGDPDVYKLFCQRYGQLLRKGGELGVVLPRSVFAAKGSASFRAWLFKHARPQRIDFLVNRGSWAFDMEPRYSVALLVAQRHAAEGDGEFESAGVAASLLEFTEQIQNPGLQLRKSALGRYLEVPLLSAQVDADLLARLRKGSPFAFGTGRWHCFPVAEFHETNDKHLWEGATEGRPLWKGESFDQFDPNGSGERRCIASRAALAKALKPRPGAESLVAGEVKLAARRDAVRRTVERARIAFRDVSRATDSRTVRACLVPPEHFLTNKAPYLAFVDDDPRSEAVCLALMNSLPFDWQARRFVEINLNFFVLEGLRLPTLDDETYAALAEASARLSCVDERFAEFASATGVGCGPLADEEREHLRVDIDARVARAYGLTPSELEVVYADFTLDAVPGAYREMVRERFAELA
jgi:hypothetical protein